MADSLRHPEAGKDFDEWNTRKKSLHKAEIEVRFLEREVWWCSLGVNVGREQDGANDLFERPILVLRKFSRDVFWALPITRTQKTGPYYLPIRVKGRNSTIILSQIRLISAKRLQRYIEKLPKKQFREVVATVKNLFPKI